MECASSLVAVVEPLATTSWNASSVATSHATGITSSACSAGTIRRVHRITAFGVGSPEATPSANGLASRSGTGAVVVVGEAVTVGVVAVVVVGGVAVAAVVVVGVDDAGVDGCAGVASRSLLLLHAA